MPKHIEVSVDELLDKRKDISDGDGHIFKAHVGPRSWNDDERSATFIMSAETEDSYRDIVVQAGIDIKTRFEANPVAFFGHRSAGLPIGKWSDIKTIAGANKRTEGKMTFAPEGIDEDVDKVARHVKVGNLRAASIGFTPKAVEKIMDAEGNWTYGYKFNEVELFECSIVSVPAVREALVRSAGTDLKEIIDPAVIEEFLEHLKANPALVKMIKPDLYEQVYREATGNKHTLTIEAPKVEIIGIDRLERAVERLERAGISAPIAADAPPPEVDDEVAKTLEEGIEKALSEVQPAIDAIPEDQVERKGVFAKVVDGIRAMLKSGGEPEASAPAAPAKADPEAQKALKAQFDELAAKHNIAA